ncbi:MAG: ABC transporter substrate-binding protein [Proteobacteria bacterium]|nr:ABC transporter substrate-binding protein [Pseudomonadota bacterium]
MLRRRHFLGAGLAGAAALARPALVRAQSATTLKFIPYADLALLDPSVSAFVTRNHVMMVFDTLFGMDEAGNTQPQMLEGFVTENDGKVWTLTLREGLKFHDGTPVLGRDVVASLQRWWVADAMGQALAAVTDELSAPSDKVVRFRLKRRFDLLPLALSHPTNNVAAIMPERLAKTPPNVKITEMVGSGPFRYLGNERVPGARNVYARFEGYVPRPNGTPSFTAGPRIAYFDRVEWLTTPDPATQAAALKAGEVDWVEQPLMDLVPALRADRNLKVEVAETKGLIGFLRFNQLFPPFDNPAIRRAALMAVNQKEFMEAVVGSAGGYDSKVGIFTPGTPFATDAGMEVLSGTHGLDSVKQALEKAGYKGEKIVFLSPTDVPRINAIAEVGVDMLRKIGMNVDEISTDWGTVVQRSVSHQPLDKGGWSMFTAYTGGYDCSNPGTHQLLRGNGNGAYNGWPDLPKIEALRNEWLAATDLTAQKQIAAKMQVQAFEDVPYLPVGAYFQPTAYKADLTGMLKGLILFTGVKRAA